MFAHTLERISLPGVDRKWDWTPPEKQQSPPLSLFHLCWEESQEPASRDGVVSPGGRERGESNSPQTCNALDF